MNKKIIIIIFFGLIFLIGLVCSQEIDNSNGTWLNFDGINDYVDLGKDIINQSSNSFTLSANIKKNVAFPTTEGTIIASFGYDNGLNQNENGKITCAVYNLSGDWFFTQELASSNIGEVNNYVCLYNKSSSEISLYKNGNLQDSRIVTGLVKNNADWRIGGMGTSTRLFNGSINKVNIFNRALSSLEIKDLYQAGNNYFNYSLNYNSSNLVYTKIIYQYNSSISYAYSYLEGYLKKSIDGGQTWIKIKDANFLSHGVETIFIDSHKNIFLTETGTGNIWRSNIDSDSIWISVPVMSCLNQNGEGFGYGTEWGFTETKNGSLLLGEYSLAEPSVANCAYIHKSTDEGQTWNVVYNGSAQYSSSDPAKSPRHIHLVRTDPYTGYIYATQGDYPGVSRLIRSTDDGITWATIEYEEDTSQYISLVFTPEYRIFGTDKGRGNKIVRTSDDIHFETVYTLPQDSDAYIWSMSKDEKTGFIIAGTLTTNSNKVSTILISPDEGTHWYSFYSFNQSTDYKGIEKISNFDSEGNAYFWDNNLLQSFKFNFNITPQKVDSLVQLNFDEGEGTIAYDSSGNGNNGTIYGATWRDIIPPTATTVTYSINTKTNQDVIATITASEPIIGETSHIFTENGNYTFTFSDLAGNNGSATATVNWIDKIAPVIDHVEDKIVNTTDSSGAIVTYNLPNAIDDVDGNVTVNCSPVSGSLFGLGNTTITCTATDLSGNTASSTFNISVVDTEIPVITLIGDSLITLEVGTSYNEQGANVSDNYDTGLNVIINSSAINTGLVGTYNVTYDVNDSSGNSAVQVIRTVNVIAKPSSSSGGHSSGGSWTSCETTWICSDWSACTDGIQNRVCSYPVTSCQPESNKPIESQSCINDNNIIEVIKPEEKQSQISIIGNFLTGAVTGVLENPISVSSGITLAVVLAILGTTITTIVIRKKRISKKK